MADYQHGLVRTYPEYTEQDCFHHGELGIASVSFCPSDNSIFILVEGNNAYEENEKSYVAIHLTKHEFMRIFNEVMENSFLIDGEK